MDVALLLKISQALLQMLDLSTANKFASAVWGSQIQLAKLKDTMTAVTAILLDAEARDRQHLQRSHIEHDWLMKLQDAVYEADDLFDEVITSAQRKGLMSGNKLAKEVRLFFSHSNQLAFLYNTSQKVKKIRERLDGIAKDHSGFGFSSPVGTNVEGRLIKRREDVHSFVDDNDVIGRDAEKKDVLDMLFDSSIQGDVSFVTVVGVGGLGKTTLARLVYNDDRTKNEFPLRLWTCISDDFNIKVIVSKLLKSTTNENYDHLDMDQLWCMVQGILSANKYLLVLDDVWNENRHKWLELRDLLIRGKKGSKILVTTRSNMVARIVGDGSIYELQGLSEEGSWHLFEKMAFENKEDRMDGDLVEIGKNVLKKCCNVPLAIKVVGSLLYGQGRTIWLSVRDTDLRKIKTDGQDDIMPVLKLSYNHLTLSLKSCFTYCAIFPKDYKIEKDILVNMWIANRFIIPMDAQNAEDAAEEHFMTLLLRCFFEDVERDDIGDIVSCKVHNLMHDVAQEVAETDVLMVNGLESQKIEKIFRHLSLSEVEVGRVLQSLHKTKHLRTVFIIGHIKGSADAVYTEIKSLFSKAKYLRVLQFSHTSIKTLPHSIKNLVHLRYLDLSYNYGLQLLPDSVCELINLQTLKLNKCWSLEILPRNLSKLVNLRNLDLKDCFNLCSMPPDMSKLTSLQSLSRFVMCCDKTVLTCRGKLDDLEMLTNLRGNLEVVFSIVPTCAGAKFREAKYAIKQLKHLKTVKVNGGSAELVECLQPHPNVKSFKLKHYEGATFPKWESSEDLRTTLPNLVKFMLFSCERLLRIPLLCRLQFLTILELNSLDNLEYIEESNSGINATDVGGNGTFSAASRLSTMLEDDKSTFFPSLQTLYLIYLPKLKGWKRCFSNGEEREPSLSFVPVPYSFPRLSLLDIKHCPNLTSIPLCSSLQKLSLCSSCNEKDTFLSYGMGFSQQLTIGFGNNDNLTSLSIVKDLFQSNLLSSSLCCLKIQGWSKLKSLCGGGLELLTALQEMCLQDLDKLEVLEDSYHMPWKSLINLHHLELNNLPRLVSLPLGFQDLTSLQSLSIQGCNKLASTYISEAASPGLVSTYCQSD